MSKRRGRMRVDSTEGQAAAFFPFHVPEAAIRGAPALKVEQEVIPYAHLHRLVGWVRRAAGADGIQAGSRVAIWSANRPELVLLLMGLWRLGAIAVPLSPRIPQNQLPAYLHQIQPTALVVDTDQLPVPFDAPCPVFDLRQWVEWDVPQGDWASQECIPLPLSTPIGAIFTSGSSGQPRAVLHSIGNHYFNALGSNRNIPLQPGDGWLLSLPLYHVGGLAILVRCFLSGASVVLPGQEPLEKALLDPSVTHISLVSTQLYRLLKNPESLARLPKLKAILLGGSAIPATLIEEGYRQGLPLVTSYGCTEMASQVTATVPGDPLDRLFTSGRLLAFRKLTIAPDGEILLAGETRCVGYLQEGELVNPFDQQGWWPSGDLGALDEQGYLLVKGRKDHMFISGGENIHPEEIEQALLRHPACWQAVVVPVPDEEFGQRPVAFVQTEREISGEEWMSFLQDWLPRFKIPRKIWPWPREASNPDWKPNRNWFRQRAIHITTTSS